MTTLVDVVNRLPISYRQAHHWAGRGFLPGVVVSGSGVVLTLTGGQVAHLGLMARLVGAGFAPRAASGYATALLEGNAVDLGSGVFLSREGS